jgi:SAM-dependent methyltransferase
MTDEDVGADFAHPARVYDYWLGGTDNFAADRAAAEQVMRFMPEILDTVRGNRRFLVRAVGFLRDAGIRQFIDIGSGLPNRPNVHEVARVGETGARVMYVDNDPLVFSRASPLLTAADGVAVVQADLRDVAGVLSRAGELLDLSQPAGLLFVGCLHHIVDADDPAGLVARYLAALAPGSYLVISHVTDDRSAEKMQANSEVAESSGAVLIPRGRDAILHMFNGRELVEPGLVLVSYWRPEGGDPGPGADQAWAYGGVAAV